GIEERPRLGSGPSPTPADLRRAAWLSRLVGAAAAVLAMVIAGSVRARRCGGHTRTPPETTGP
ncbi:MAG: hypothetical protein L0H64_21750, partial [Pseudonocardia sp.]|nr:hypothetical protein [Pseudonocardia sp.]